MKSHFRSGTHAQVFGKYKGGVGAVINATPVWQSPAAGALASAAGSSAYSQQFTATSPVGNPLTYIFQTGTMPPGAALTATGLLSGTLFNPASDTTYSFTIRATDGSAYTDRAFSLTVAHSANQDPYAQYVVGLWHFDGNTADASTNALDMVGTFDATWQAQTTTAKFGSGSFYAAGPSATASTYLSIPSSAALNATGDFCFEFWWKSNGVQVGNAHWFQNIGADANCIGVESNTGSSGRNTWYFLNSAGSSVNLQSTTNTTNDGNWHHIAFTRVGSTVYLFFDGTLQASTTSTHTIGFGAATGMYVLSSDRSTSTRTNGYLDEMRLTIGAGRYSANFTPPTAAFAYP